MSGPYPFDSPVGGNLQGTRKGVSLRSSGVGVVWDVAMDVSGLAGRSLHPICHGTGGVPLGSRGEAVGLLDRDR